VLRQTRRRGDGDVLLFAGRLVLCRHVQNAVRVDVERHLDLRDAAWRRRDADEVEPAERPVVARHLALALEDVGVTRRLAVRGGGEDLALLRREDRKSTRLNSSHGSISYAV